MTSYTKHKTQTRAIIEARQFAAESAMENASDWTAKVILMSGDTLCITATESGKITERTTSGWDRDGDIFCGPKAYAIAQ